VKLSRQPDTVNRLADGDLKALLIQDAELGWRAFIDQYTPVLLAYLERAGIRDRDEAMELYVLTCERLAADDCARLRRHDPAKGSLGAWLAVLVRNVTVDWVRSRAGRRRLFGSIKRLSPLDRRVFELFFWENRSVSELVGLLAPEFDRPSLAGILESLERVQSALTERQRSDLLAMTARSAIPASLDGHPEEEDDRPYDIADRTVDAEGDLQAREAEVLMERALAGLPAEDAAIARLKYGEGLSLKQIRDALHLDQLSDERVQGILDALRETLRMSLGPTAAGSSGQSEASRGLSGGRR
jgi:DNA-directed RNA polymerase specialized sigma24 family protein